MLPELNVETVQLKMTMLALTLGLLILKMTRKFITRKLKWVALFQQMLTPKEKKKKSVKNFLMPHSHTIGILVMSH